LKTENSERTFPELSKAWSKSLYTITHILRDTLESLTDVEKPNVINTGIFNSAYFEH
jgi:uncharacterized circularly permuted ATP-grasp superfamily protein